MKHTLSFIAVLFCLLFSQAERAYGETLPKARVTAKQVLSCPETLSRVNMMLDLHYAYNDFTPELSARTFNKMFDNYDAAKLFFTTEDRAHFNPLKSQMNDRLEDGDCDFMFEFHKSFLKRLRSRMNTVKSFLSQPITFSENEKFMLKKKSWSKNEEDANEFIRKRIKFQVLTLKLDGHNEGETRLKIQKIYDRMEERYFKMNDDAVYSLFLNSFAQSLDPHSAHMLPAEHEIFTSHISNKIQGIGAQLQEVNGFIVVYGLTTNGAAKRSGQFQINDRIIAIDAGRGAGWQTTLGMEVGDVAALIRGRKGSQVHLQLLRHQGGKNHTRIVTLTREEVDLKSDNIKSEIYTTSENIRIGVIKIASFYTDLNCRNRMFLSCKGVAYDTKEKLKSLFQQGVDGVLVDLRNNGGGDFPESIRLTSLFLPSGTVVQTVDKQQQIKKQPVYEGGWYYRGPVVILINRMSASASEIFAGAIQDYGRGMIVGDDHTYGKATVQIVQEIQSLFSKSGNGAIKVTQSKFYRPGGSSNQMVGVKSDIVVPSLLSAYNIGETTLDYPLPPDYILPAKGFQPLQTLTELIQSVQARSEKRMQENPDFIKLNHKVANILRDQNQALPLTPKYSKYFEEMLTPNSSYNRDPTNPTLIQNSDIQLLEAIRVTSDAIRLTKNNPSWTAAPLIVN